MIFDIQHFCTHDGPGIRTTVFLKGCPLRCLWCHNPESQSFKPEILVNPMKCISCGECERLCPHHSSHKILASAQLRSELCGDCLSCASACPAGALEIAGKDASVEEVLGEVLMDKDYYANSGGGVTLSGGEPFASPSFTLPFLAAAKAAGLHTAVETSGCCTPEVYLKAAPDVDLFLWDIKLMDEDLYAKYTGGCLSAMLSSLEAVRGSNIRFRILFIPDIHLSEKIISATAELLSKYPEAEWEVIPYHLLGNSKREKLGKEKVVFREPSAEEIHQFENALRSHF